MARPKYARSNGIKTTPTRKSRGEKHHYWEPSLPIAGIGDSIKALMVKLDGMNPKKP